MRDCAESSEFYRARRRRRGFASNRILIFCEASPSCRNCFTRIFSCIRALRFYSRAHKITWCVLMSRSSDPDRPVAPSRSIFVRRAFRRRSSRLHAVPYPTDSRKRFRPESLRRKSGRRSAPACAHITRWRRPGAIPDSQPGMRSATRSGTGGLWIAGPSIAKCSRKRQMEARFPSSVAGFDPRSERIAGGRLVFRKRRTWSMPDLSSMLRGGPPLLRG